MLVGLPPVVLDPAHLIALSQLELQKISPVLAGYASD